MVHACHSDPGLNFLIPSAVLIASFLGSLHCVGMCGGLVVASTRTKLDHIAYHIGRLLGYMGVTAGIVVMGQSLLNQFQAAHLHLYLSILMGVWFIIMGLIVIKTQNFQFHLKIPFVDKILKKLLRSQSSTHSSPLIPGLIGVASVGLPCGWLYLFVIGAASLGTLKGALIAIFLFWLGTVPALGLSPFLFQKLLSPLQNKRPWIIGGLFILVGCVTLFFRVG